MTLAVSSAAVALGQTQDTSGNGMLSGNFHFRHVAILNLDQFGDPTEIAAIFGTIAFDGKGNYTVTGTEVDNTISNGAPQPLSVKATYAIGSNGAGYVANPLFPTDYNTYIYGAVAQGVFTGSSTEAGAEGLLNDIFVAIPGGSVPTNATFTTSYQTGLLDFAGAGSGAVNNAVFELTPNGQGTLGSIALQGQSSNQTGPLQQSVTGATYNFTSDGSATLTIPLPAGVSSTNALFTGTKTVFQSADGNFILGWTASGYDVFFGVKAMTIASSNLNSVSAGLYFTAALEDIPTSTGPDSYYGGTFNFGDSNGDAIIHQRVNIPGILSLDFGSDDLIALNSDGTTLPDYSFGYQYIFGDAGNCQNGSSTFSCGQAFVAIGSNGYFSLLIGLHVPPFSGAGVYLNPVGVVNAASFQPITASLAPGELITLFGTGLASTTLTSVGGQAFPLSLGGVSATIDDIPCPIYYVSPTQMSIIVPYGVAANMTGLANIQVTNNNVASNVVQMYLTDALPGVFSQETNPILTTVNSDEPSIDGIGYAAALHANYSLITPSNPAQLGETILVYLTGLGTVTPTVNDGAIGPSGPLSQSDLNGAGFLGVFFNDYVNGSFGNQAAVAFAGLAPGFAGLYQLNVTIPDSGLGSGDDVYLAFLTDAADINQIQIPMGSGVGTSFAKATRGGKRSGSNGALARKWLINAKKSQRAAPLH